MKTLLLRKTLVLFLVCWTVFLFIPQSYAIVNMQALHFDELEKGVGGSVELSAARATGNSVVEHYRLDLQVHQRQADYINIGLVGYEYGKSNDQKNIDKSFAHLRHIRDLSGNWDYEFFTQIEQNEFTRLSSRWLLGAGARYLFKRPDWDNYVGVGAFYSEEEIDAIAGQTDGGKTDAYRANLYWLTRYKLTSNADLNGAFYYQPDVEALSDYRALFQGAIKVKINDKIKLNVSLDAAYDSRPPQLIKKDDTTTRVSIQYDF